MNIDHSGTMEIFRNNMIGKAAEGGQETASDFSAMLEADTLRMNVMAKRNAIMTNQEPRSEPMNTEDINYIREHGMQAYVEELQKKKIEELREKILASMGFTEESLSEMNPDQRNAIEEMIRNEIQKRLQTNSLMNGDAANDNGAFLKTMMVMNNAYSFFENPSLVPAKGFKEYMAENADAGGAYDFFRSNTEESDR